MYIIDSYSICAQNFFNYLDENQEMEIFEDLIYFAKEPDYMDYIPASVLRRMGKAVRMGIGSGLKLLNAHKDIDGIIIGTAHGGLEDCIKFLNQIVHYEEGLLTPTNFVQSTPNAIAGQLALMNQNHGYNMTHINKGSAFENSIMDAWIQFQNKDINKLLIGSVEENSDYNKNIDFWNGKFKEEKVPSNKILASDTPGTNLGEASIFFILDKKENKNATKIVDFHTSHRLQLEDLEDQIMDFLGKNNISKLDIANVISGRNGDSRLNEYYNTVESIFDNASIYAFKHWIGENPSASAFALYMAHLIAQNTLEIPKYKNAVNKSSDNYILVYNSYDGISHHFYLLK